MNEDDASARPRLKGLSAVSSSVGDNNNRGPGLKGEQRAAEAFDETLRIGAAPTPIGGAPATSSEAVAGINAAVAGLAALFFGDPDKQHHSWRRYVPVRRNNEIVFVLDPISEAFDAAIEKYLDPCKSE